jgi:hypothetical protein
MLICRRGRLAFFDCLVSKHRNVNNAYRDIVIKACENWPLAMTLGISVFLRTTAAASIAR